MPYQRVDWLANSGKYHHQVDNYLSEVQLIRSDIAFTRDKAESEAARRRRPANFDELLQDLERAKGFLEDEEIPTRSYRQEWEQNMRDVQTWGVKNVRRERGPIRKFIGRLWACHSEAAQLRDLVANTRRELGL
jgi:hypothetical protein